LLCSQCPVGHVYSFEPSPVSAAFLRKNIDLNGIKNCTVVQSGVGIKTGEAILSPVGASAQIVGPAHPNREVWNDVKIPVLLIDEYVRSIGIQRLDFIKIDIEGYEPMALAGARATIAAFSPPIFMEFNSWCLYFAHRFDPLNFAQSLWHTFEVMSVNADGTLSPCATAIRLLSYTITWCVMVASMTYC